MFTRGSPVRWPPEDNEESNDNDDEVEELMAMAALRQSTVEGGGGSRVARRRRHHHHYRNHSHGHDHRALDLDEMSYEQLQELCDHMGSVKITLGPELLSLLPALPVQEGEHFVCAICTEEMVPGEHRRSLPCKDMYHKNCIDQWLLNEKPTCPVCQMNLKEVLDD
eukprot:TRINITY_DN7716_c0_g1_i1.p1 TRINITY_DN7716_c0_g1~~TRINITY_DN7716_c0_g1_i1.p1  ORF type:complete len:166 (+),score=25.45 TRINITY_DN7716_c0_g1_i1:47-544(+)